MRRIATAARAVGFVARQISLGWNTQPHETAPTAQPTEYNDDFGKPLAMMDTRVKSSYGSLQRVESKIATLIAGTLAAMALTLDKGSSLLNILLAAGYLVPLQRLLFAFHPKTGHTVPDGELLGRFWGYYPKEMTERVFRGTVHVADELAQRIEAESFALRTAINWVFWWSLIVIVMRLVESVAESTGTIHKWMPHVEPFLGIH